MPHFTLLPSNVTVSKEGQFVHFHCRAEGQPVPSIQWDKDSVLNGYPFDRYYLYTFNRLNYKKKTIMVSGLLLTPTEHFTLKMFKLKTKDITDAQQAMQADSNGPNSD